LLFTDSTGKDTWGQSAKRDVKRLLKGEAWEAWPRLAKAKLKDETSAENARAVKAWRKTSTLDPILPGLGRRKSARRQGSRNVSRRKDWVEHTMSKRSG
ncbi:MAG: uncharacterized protein A8A55_3594, partial [Amphiamblys sp. WSBS2006]